MVEFDFRKLMLNPWADGACHTLLSSAFSVSSNSFIAVTVENGI